MLEILANLEKRAKEYFSNVLNIVLLVCIANTVFSVFLYLQISEFKNEFNRIVKSSEISHNAIKNKIDHRYFNLTTTLSEIHNTKINTRNGELK